MNTKILQQLMGIMLVTLLLVGCGGVSPEPTATPIQPPQPPTATPVPPAPTEVTMPNPASVFCEDQGGRIEIRAGEGGQVGYCVFPDGNECEEWAFFRGECVPGGGEYQPPDSAVCSDLSKTMVQTLGVAVTTEEAPFVDHISGKAGTGCQMTAIGTGLDFENFWSVAEALRETLGSQGWQADFMYAADGPTGTGNGGSAGPSLISLGTTNSAEPSVKFSANQRLSSMLVNAAFSFSSGWYPDMAK